jgi:hypothetical protein
MKIIVQEKILSGNLGDGWKDNYEAACRLKELTEEVYTEDLSEFARAGFEIELDIEVERATGYVGDRQIWVKPMEDDAAETLQDVEYKLTSKSEIWERFCRDEAFTYLYGDEE